MDEMNWMHTLSQLGKLSQLGQLKWVLLLALLLSVVGTLALAQGPEATDLAVVDLTARGVQAAALDTGRSTPAMTVPAVTKTAVSTAAPGQEVGYTVTLVRANT